MVVEDHWKVGRLPRIFVIKLLPEQRAFSVFNKVASSADHILLCHPVLVVSPKVEALSLIGSRASSVPVEEGVLGLLTNGEPEVVAIEHDLLVFRDVLQEGLLWLVPLLVPQLAVLAPSALQEASCSPLARLVGGRR